MSYHTDLISDTQHFYAWKHRTTCSFFKLVFVKTALRMTQIKSNTIRKASPNSIHGFVETYHIDLVAYTTKTGFGGINEIIPLYISILLILLKCGRNQPP